MSTHAHGQGKIPEPNELEEVLVPERKVKGRVIWHYLVKIRFASRDAWWMEGDLVDNLEIFDLYDEAFQLEATLRRWIWW